jgi:hypothetical protein
MIVTLPICCELRSVHFDSIYSIDLRVLLTILIFKDCPISGFFTLNARVTSSKCAVRSKSKFCWWT